MRVGWLWSLGAVLMVLCRAVAAEPYGLMGPLGPDGALQRTCAASTSCYVCAPSSCTPSGNWQERIESATPGDTILLRAGTYQPNGTLDVPDGSPDGLVTVANYNGEAATILGGLRLGSHALIEGLTIDRGSSGAYAIEIDRRTGTPKRSIMLRHLDVLGGTGEAIRIRGHVKDVTITGSLLDGGRNNHVVKVLCDDNSNVAGGSCNWAPETTLTSNKFTKIRAFPGAGGEDLLQFDGAGDTVVTHNDFGDNPDGEDCVDWKTQGASGTSIVFSHNLVRGCRYEGILFQQGEPDGSTVIEGNRLEGNSNLLRRVHAGTQVINNVFASHLTISASDLTLAFNTHTGNLKFGDTTQGAPRDLQLINSIFWGTRFSCSSVGCGDYAASRNVVYETTGSMQCSNCISTDPLLSDYQIAAGSSAENKASSAFLVTNDIEGTTRPQGPAPEIGAFELVDRPDPPAPTASLKADPPQIAFGGSSTLRWQSANATSCTSTQFETGGEVAGQAVVSPTETTTYGINCAGAIDSATVTVDEVAPPDQQPFAANLVPGRIEGEDYDLGGEGIAYHDTDAGNNGGAYRTDDVDIKAEGASYTIGWGDTGEWLEWTIDVQETGDYRIEAFAGTADSGTPAFTVALDGAPLANVMAPYTGSWDVKQYVEVGTVALAAGRYLLRVDIDEGYVDLDHFEFLPVVQPRPGDTTPPVVEIVRPQDGARLRRRRHRLVVIDAADEDSGVDAVTLRIEGQAVATFSGAGEHVYAWRPMGRRYRWAVLEATAVDHAGNSSSHSVTVKVTR